MSNILYYEPGEVVTIILEIYNTNSTESEPTTPIISTVYSPNLKPLIGFPIPFSKLYNEDGIYIARFKLPKDVYGTYICIAKWQDQDTFAEKKKTYSIIINKQAITAITSTGL